MWAIEEDYLAWMQRQLAGDVSALIEAAPARAMPAQRGTTMVIPVRGPITKRASLFTLFFGGSSTEGIRAQFREALNNEAVGSIVLDIDSPGGSVDDVPELADEIAAARGVKPIAAVANGMMASAAYWIGSQADTIYVTPSGMAGSIGVWTMHIDQSGFLEQEGLDVSLVSAGKYKVEGNPFEPLTDGARAAIQHDVDVFYGMFVDAVARGRSREGARVSAADVRGGYGEGRLLTAKDAVRAGLADKVATFEDVVTGLGRGRKGGTRADDERRWRWAAQRGRA